MKNARCESVNTLRNTHAGQSTNAAMLGTRTLLKGVATLPARPVAGCSTLLSRSGGPSISRPSTSSPCSTSASTCLAQQWQGKQARRLNSSRHVACRLTPQPAVAQLATDTQADLIFEVPGTKAKVHVFGIDHRSAHPHVGEFILRNRPQAVVVETAVCAEHGAAPGTSISCADQIAIAPQAFFVRMFCQLAAQLQAEGGSDPCGSELWQQMKHHYRGEQLAYIAAFATDAKLVFADRPKDITYKRLAALVSPAQLDKAFGALCEDHYRVCLGLPSPQAHHDADGNVPITERIMMQEREAVMCKVVDDLCRSGLPKAGLSSPATSVVVVVGRSHLSGLQHLWEGQRWQGLVGQGELAASLLLSAPPTPQASGDADMDVGIRRGLLQAAMRMMVTHEVLADMNEVLGPLTPAQQEVVDTIEEIYGCNRMMLAALPKELLAAVCSGNGCDMYEVLEPFRKVRPMYGGPAYAPDMIETVRGLNFELDE